MIPAGSAEEGFELVQRLRFDLVFCAIRLPGLNWVEFSERVRPLAAAVETRMSGAETGYPKFQVIRSADRKKAAN